MSLWCSHIWKVESINPVGVLPTAIRKFSHPHLVEASFEFLSYWYHGHYLLIMIVNLFPYLRFHSPATSNLPFWEESPVGCKEWNRDFRLSSCWLCRIPQPAKAPSKDSTGMCVCVCVTHAVIRALAYDQEGFHSYLTQAQITYLIPSFFWLSFPILKMDLIVHLCIILWG